MPFGRLSDRWGRHRLFLAGHVPVLGIYARQVSLILVPVMLGAAWVHLPNGWVFRAKNGGWEYPVFLAVASVAQWLIGDGAFALRRSARFMPIATANANANAAP